MSNAAPHHKPRTSTLRLVQECEVAVDTRLGSQKTAHAFGVACIDCGYGSDLFEFGVSRPCESCVPFLVERAARALHATGHHVAVDVPAVVEVATAEPTATPEEEPSAFCGKCGAWVGLKADHTTGGDACGWIRGGK